MTEQARVAITRSDGSVAIMSFVTRGFGASLPFGAVWEDRAGGTWVREPTDVNVFAEVSRSLADAVRFRVIGEGELPSERTYRDAWTDTGKAVAPDLEKAKAIQLARVRAARAPKLAELDGKWMKATGTKDAAGADAVEAQRQTLRDLPDELGIASAKTIDELKAAWSPLLD